MPQASQAPTKYNFNALHISPRIVLGSRRIPSSTVGDEKKNSSKCINCQSQLFMKSSKRHCVCDTSSNPDFIRRFPFKVTSRSKHSDHHISISTCAPKFGGSLIPSCRKSHSMIELSPVKPNLEGDCYFGFETGLNSAWLDQLRKQTIEPRISLWSNQVIKTNSEQMQEMLKKAAGLVCHALILNAWRYRRDEVRKLHDAVRQLSQQITHLQLQTVVLKRLLKTENNRIGKLGAEIYRAKIELENTSKEKTELAAEKDILEIQTKKLEKVAEWQIITSKNCKNELLSTKSQLKDVEAQINRDHEKLSKLREDKKFLLEKVLSNEAIAAERSKRADRAEVIAKDLQEKLKIQIGIINRLQDDKNTLNRELRDAEADKNRLNDCLLVINNTEKTLNLQAESLTLQLSDREAALRKIESAYNTQLVELNELRRLSQQVGWSQRVFEIAGNMVRAPRAIFRTFAFL